MKSDNKRLIESIYNPYSVTKVASGFSAEDFYHKSYIRYFSLARHALKAGLLALGLNNKSTVLIPSFICRDVLAPFNELGIKIIFYEVSEDLQLKEDGYFLPKADAIMVIHYFGLASNLRPFLEYCERRNALLIEDNAHGFLSARATGPLGTRGDIGIISIRKTLPIENGALLISQKKLPNQLETIPKGSIRLKVKNALRPLVAKFGTKPLIQLTKIKRKARSLLMGGELPTSNLRDEFQIPGLPNPTEFKKQIRRIDFSAEVERRRNLFYFIHDYLTNTPIKPYRRSLEPGESPYAYPFFCTNNNINAVKEKLGLIGLEIVNWPALPQAVSDRPHPTYFDELYLVKLLW